jgi:hypothetical protein
VPLFIYTLAFTSQLRKSTENLSQASRAVVELCLLNHSYITPGKGKQNGNFDLLWLAPLEVTFDFVWVAPLEVTARKIFVFNHPYKEMSDCVVFSVLRTVKEFARIG